MKADLDPHDRIGNPRRPAPSGEGDCRANPRLSFAAVKRAGCCASWSARAQCMSVDGLTPKTKSPGYALGP